VDLSGPKDAQVQSYLPGGANLPDDTLPCAVQKRLNRSTAVWVVKSGSPKEAQVQLYSPGGANVPHGSTHCRHLANTIEPFVYAGDTPYVKLL